MVEEKIKYERYEHIRKLYKMKKRNIIATEGYNGQNMLIDLDNSRIVITNSAATGWDVRTYMLNVIRKGELPK